MSTKQELQAAVEVFRELGWEDATQDMIMGLPAGTKEQRAVAVAGLKSGEWQKYSEEERSFINQTGVDLTMLTLFAIRMGVPAPRCISLIDNYNRFANLDALPFIVAERGEKFAQSFIKAACGSRMPAPGFKFLSAAPETVLRLVFGDYGVDLGIPSYPTYLQDWACLVCFLFPSGGVDPSDAEWMEQPYRNEAELKFSALSPTFRAHVEAGLSAGVGLSGSFGRAIFIGATVGLLSRDEALSAIARGLDLAQRQGERRRLVALLTEDFQVTDAEISAHFAHFATALATSDPTYCAAFGSRIIALASELQLVDAAAGPLHVTTATGQKAALKALVEKPTPPREIIAQLEPRITKLATSRNAAVQKLAAGLLARWNIEESEEEGEFLPWVSAPPLWECPRFDKGPVTLENFISAVRRSTFGLLDVHAERRNALLVALANEDMDVARRAVDMCEDYESWLWFTSSKKGRNGLNPVVARSAALVESLGKIPVLLSEPSYEDLSIDFDDLMGRLELYREAGADVMEPDLQLALFRLNLDTADAAKARAVDVPMRVFGADHANNSAGTIIASFIENPITEPSLVAKLEKTFVPAAPTYPSTLGLLPPRLTRWVKDTGVLPVGLFPAWMVTPATHLVRSSIGRSKEVAADIACAVAQLARSRRPLGAGFVMNLLALQQPGSLPVHEDIAAALFDAWERGLIQPGVADPALLEWSTSPAKFSGLAPTLEQLAQDGLLSIVWPVLDGLLGLAPKPSAATAEVAEAICALLPSVVHAVEQHQASREQLALPALRRFAGMSKANKTTAAAKKALALIPDISM